MDAKTLIHVGAEIVVIGGISFWFHKRIGDQNAIITKITDENKKLTERVENLEKMLMQQHQELQQLMQMLGVQPQQLRQPPIHQSLNYQPPVHQSSNYQPPIQQPPNQPQIHQPPSQTTGAIRKNPRPSSNQESKNQKSGQSSPPAPKPKIKRKPKPAPPLVNDDDIDALLENEIKQVEFERNNHIKTSSNAKTATVEVSETSINDGDGEVLDIPGEYVEDGTTDLP